MATPLARIIVFVKDVELCTSFYVETFGFRRISEGDDPGEWAELDTGGCRLAFHRARGAKGPTGSKGNPHKIVFFAKDVAARRTELVAHGVAMGKLHTFGELTFCDGTDPEGHVFQISNRP